MFRDIGFMILGVFLGRVALWLEDNKYLQARENAIKAIKEHKLKEEEEQCQECQQK
jgi:hypothetical protein